MSAPTIRCNWVCLYGALLGALLIVVSPALGEATDHSRILIHAVVLGGRSGTQPGRLAP